MTPNNPHQTKTSRRLGNFETAALYEYLPLIAIIGLFIGFKLFYLAPRFSDGHIYSYLGRLVASGSLPYRDFYYSSPPFLPYAIAFLGALSGWRSWIFDAIPLFFAAIDALLIYRIGRLHAPRFESLVGVTIYLTAYITLATTDFASDVHWITSLSLAAWYAISKEKYKLAGILLAATILVKVYAVAIAAGIIAVTFFGGKRRQSVTIAMISFIIPPIVCALFYGIIGPPVFEQVIFNNLNRHPGINKGAILAFFFSHDVWVPAVGLFLGIQVLARRQNFSSFIPVLVYGAFFTLYQDVYYLYLKPFAAYAGVIMAHLSAPARKFSAILRPLISIVILLCAGSQVKDYIREQVNASTIEGIDGIVEKVRELTAPGDPIYGDSSFAPLVALLADRPIFRNYVDTNVKFVNQGLFTLESRAKEVKEQKVKVVLTKAVVVGSALKSLSPVLPADFLLASCHVAKAFPLSHDYTENAVLVWSCP